MAWQLFPRDSEYFEIYTALAEKSIEAAQYFCHALEQKPSIKKQENMKPLEKEADNLVEQVIIKLEEAADPPFDDREDNLELATKLDDIVDEIEKTFNRINCFEVETDNHMKKSAAVILNTTKKIKKAVCLLDGLSKQEKRDELSRLVQQIEALEEEADSLHRQNRSKLARVCRQAAEKRDLVEYNLNSNKIFITNRLEAISDVCEEVGRLLERIKKKN